MSLTTRAVASAIWHVGAGLGGRVIGALGTLVLTRYLNPDVMGEVGVAWVLVLTSQVATCAGFGQYVVAHPSAGPSAGFHVTALSTGAIAVVSLLLVAPINVPCCQLNDSVTSGTMPARRPPKRIASIGTPFGSSHSGAITGH